MVLAQKIIKGKLELKIIHQKVFICLLGLLFSNKVCAQNHNQVILMIQSADSAYNLKQYSLSSKYCSAAYNLQRSSFNANMLYNCACSFALINSIDSAFLFLKQAAGKGMYALEHLQKDSDLIKLHDFKDWDMIISIVAQNKEKKLSLQDRKLIYSLDSMCDLAENYRRLLSSDTALLKYTLKGLSIKIMEVDSLNSIFIENLLVRIGWPSRTILGLGGVADFISIVQHAPLNFQIKWLKLMKEAVVSGEVFKQDLAMLQDRVLVRLGMPQLYGTQISHDSYTGKYQLCPIENIDKVDSLRIEMGLEPIDQYLKNWDLNWEVEKTRLNNRKNN